MFPWDKEPEHEKKLDARLRPRNMRLLSVGVPMLGIMVVGTLVVGYAMEEKFERRKLLHQGRVRPREIPDDEVIEQIEKVNPYQAALDRAMKAQLEEKRQKRPMKSLEEEVDIMDRKIELEQWKQVRIPRPGEVDAPQRMKEAAAATKKA